MCFNATKCYIMSIHRSRNPLTTHYILSNHILEQVQENPYLGVIISENLKWSTYINKMHDIMKSFDSKKQTDLVILDFSKVFNTVPHKKLLHKLNNYGIGRENKQMDRKFSYTTSTKSNSRRRFFIIMLSRIWSTPKNRPWISSFLVSHQ